ncbi:MAG TPA: Holliday junction branch migration protein RuvA [Caldithrix abyssi]|uniref:Holliday junction branch migration complex subunit RuvA n=1 Tax=Caldithrix abyssi TaxID=187145 RepID=A0A7V1PVC1_CALAY|nr:Holliday junction branch migration protein RuvA [Caldithrix abyssi]
MFEYIQGILETKSPTYTVLDIQGLGYRLSTSLSTFEKLPAVGDKVKLFVYTHVREDQFNLFGFWDTRERDVFLALLSISGIGPKLAQTILSGLTPDELIAAIEQKDEKRLNSISGVGKKTAQRLIIELKGKFESEMIMAAAEKETGLPPMNSMEKEALMALLALGYKKPVAERAMARIKKKGGYTTLEALLKDALQVV